MGSTSITHFQSLDLHPAVVLYVVFPGVIANRLMPCVVSTKIAGVGLKYGRTLDFSSIRLCRSG